MLLNLVSKLVEEITAHKWWDLLPDFGGIGCSLHSVINIFDASGGALGD